MAGSTSWACGTPATTLITLSARQMTSNRHSRCRLRPSLIPASEPYVLIVTVPASSSAPHMVGEKYWGRGATGKRHLADVEVSRLFVERRRRGDDFRDRMEGLSTNLDPLPPEPRRHAHVYVMAEPDARMGPLTGALGHNALQVVFDSRVFQPPWSPAARPVSTCDRRRTVNGRSLLSGGVRLWLAAYRWCRSHRFCWYPRRSSPAPCRHTTRWPYRALQSGSRRSRRNDGFRLGSCGAAAMGTRPASSGPQGASASALIDSWSGGRRQTQFS